MIIDGVALAQETLASVRACAERLTHRPLLVALAGELTPATQSYLKIKQRRATEAGCDFKIQELGSEYTDADSVIVQLPLPLGVDAQVALGAIPVEKDADVLSPLSREKFNRGDVDALLPPVVSAVKKILEFGKVEIRGKNATIIGAGFLVGAPVATWLKQQGANITVVTLDNGDLVTALRFADIVVSGAGSPHLIKPEMLKDGVVLIDAGTSESNWQIVGDAHPSCATKCSLFTPVPGGVGPLAVACLFENVVTLASLRR